MNAAEHEADADEEAAPATGDSLFGTETMAELCVRQGRIGEALAIYRGLLRGLLRGPLHGLQAAGPADDQRRTRWRERLSALENPSDDGRPARDATAALPGPPCKPTATAPARAVASAPLAVKPGAGSAHKADNQTRLRGVIHRLPLVIREPVRSGQIVYAEKNDLIVLGPVNPGAQLIADGNIHIYSRLRGRAVAGAHGAGEARIYCQKLEAELVGVDSAYVIADDIPAALWGRPAQIFLQAGRCVIVAL